MLRQWRWGDDLGGIGRVYLETDVETADLEKSPEGKVRHPVFKGLREDL
jgi:hypothetical protein